MILALDTETTGTDFFHGCRPFLITGCDGTYNYLWRGRVNASTREVTWNQQDLDEVRSLIDSASTLIFHNVNFDRRALESIGIDLTPYLDKIEDTLLLAHVMCSSDVHGLKAICTKYLRYYDTDEKLMDAAVVAERQRLAHSDVAIARHGHPHFPAAPKNSKWAKMDMWLAPENAEAYAVKDAERTWLIYQVFKNAPELGFYEPKFKWYPDHNRFNNRWCQYRFRKELLPVLYDMQSYGINVYINKLDRLVDHLEFQLQGLTNLIVHTSKWQGYLNPDSDKHLDTLLYDVLNLPPIKETKGGARSTDKETLTLLFEQFPNVLTLRYLKAWKETNTELEFLRAYKLWVSPDPPSNNGETYSGITLLTQSTTHTSYVPPTTPQRIHGTTNPTGTKWTRNSASDPNTQNFKKELDFLFGPPEGYYWLYQDVVNIELRIWAYDTQNADLIQAFESGSSVHLIIARAIRQHQIDAAGGEVNWQATDPRHKQYTKTKGGTFSWIYGGSETKVNNTYGIDNAVSIIRAKLPGVAEYFKYLQETCTANIPVFGYPTLHTIQGYPLQVPRTKPHKASSARIQGTAGLIVQDMMVSLSKDPLFRDPKLHPRFIQQVHDSITIELPIHSYMEATNAYIINLTESIGARHIPTCPMKPELILPTPEKSFRLKMPTILPEEIEGYTVTYYFEDGVGWIAEAKHGSVIIEETASSHELVRNTIICTLRK